MTTAMPEGGVCHRHTDLLPLFYSDNPAEQAQARAMCFDCSVQFECLEYAIEGNERFGIFGGCLPSERVVLRNARKGSQ